MSFQNPEYVWLLLLIPAAVLFDYLIALKKRRDLEKIAHSHLVEKLTRTISLARRGFKRAVIYLTLISLTICLMRPQWGQRLVKMERKGIDIVFLIDVSRSMLAEDIKPNRLEKAKIQISAFLDRLQGDRVGLVVFAGSAFVSCPLTLDYNALKMFIDQISTELVARQGTHMGNALKTARDCFDPLETKYKAIVLLTDGEDHENSAIEEAINCSKEGIKIYSVGLGKRAGEPIPKYDRNGNITGYLKDRKGKVVMSRLDEITLQKLALETRGKYYYAQFGDLELDKIYSHLQQLEKKKLDSKTDKLYEDQFQNFVLISIVLLLLEILMSDRRSSWLSRLFKVEDEPFGRYE